VSTPKSLIARVETYRPSLHMPEAREVSSVVRGCRSQFTFHYTGQDGLPRSRLRRRENIVRSTANLFGHGKASRYIRSAKRNSGVSESRRNTWLARRMGFCRSCWYFLIPSAGRSLPAPPAALLLRIATEANGGRFHRKPLAPFARVHVGIRNPAKTRRVDQS